MGLFTCFYRTSFLSVIINTHHLISTSSVKLMCEMSNNCRKLGGCLKASWVQMWYVFPFLPRHFFVNQNGGRWPSWKKSKFRFLKRQVKSSCDTSMLGNLGMQIPFLIKFLFFNFSYPLDKIFKMDAEKSLNWSMNKVNINRKIWNKM